MEARNKLKEESAEMMRKYVKHMLEGIRDIFNVCAGEEVRKLAGESSVAAGAYLHRQIARIACEIETEVRRNVQSEDEVQSAMLGIMAHIYGVCAYTTCEGDDFFDSIRRASSIAAKMQLTAKLEDLLEKADGE